MNRECLTLRLACRRVRAVYFARLGGARPPSGRLRLHINSLTLWSSKAGMKMRSRNLWIIAFILVTFAALYQRMTGPTYPMRASVTIGGADYRFRLPRSSGSPGDEAIQLAVPDTRITGAVELRRFRSNDPWTKQDLVREGEFLIARIPHQPPAGKVMYRIGLSDGSEPVWLTSEPVVIRFKGDVPAVVMGPHIVLMFLAMLFSTRAGLEAVLRRPNLRVMTVWTTISLGIGGMILGPVVQKLAFGAYWTGWPFGYDLTDNKTVIAFLFWVLAWWRLRKNPEARGWALIASVVLFLVYMIPHSVLGSELDYTQMPAPKG